MTGAEPREHVAELVSAEGLFHYYECGRCGSKPARQLTFEREKLPLDDHGLVSLASAFSVAATVDRLVGAVDAAGLVVFARIDHGQGAADIGAGLRPTQLVMFGHPRGGTPLMQERQTAGIDLPLKAVAWEDANGRVWLTYNRGAWIGDRHELGEQSSDAVAAIDAGLAKLVATATGQA